MNKKAFTLLELLIVVLIIGILAGIALPQYKRAVLKSQFMQLMVLQDSIEHAEHSYFLNYNEYTKNYAELDIDIPNTKITTSITGSPDILYYGKYQIHLAKNYSEGFVNNMSLVRYHGQEVYKECRVYDDSEIKKQVCKLLGGVKVNCSVCPYEIYRF